MNKDFVSSEVGLIAGDLLDTQGLGGACGVEHLQRHVLQLDRVDLTADHLQQPAAEIALYNK